MIRAETETLCSRFVSQCAGIRALRFGAGGGANHIWRRLLNLLPIASWAFMRAANRRSLSSFVRLSISSCVIVIWLISSSVFNAVFIALLYCGLAVVMVPSGYQNEGGTGTLAKDS